MIARFWKPYVAASADVNFLTESSVLTGATSPTCLVRADEAGTIVLKVYHPTKGEVTLTAIKMADGEKLEVAAIGYVSAGSTVNDFTVFWP